MPDHLSTNRTMFWRIVRRLLVANRARLCVLLLALAAAATITAALLNLQIDARRRLTTEFRAFGPNIVVAPHADANALVAPTLDEALQSKIPVLVDWQRIDSTGVLFVMADVSVADSKTSEHVVLTGKSTYLKPSSSRVCVVGFQVAQRMDVHEAQILALHNQNRQERCTASLHRAVGSSDDSQIIVPLTVTQTLAGLPKRVSLFEITAPGTSSSIDRLVSDLMRKIPEAEVRPVRQFTEAEGKIYNRISGLLTATVALVLILTALCVMAGMTNAAMERKNDVGLMKAIGGASRRVLRFFIAEAAVLGLAGGVIGAAAGIGLSIWLGQAVFGVAARPRLIVYPVAVTLTVIVAIAGALPLRRLASIRPASVFRGE